MWQPPLLLCRTYTVIMYLVHELLRSCNYVLTFLSINFLSVKIVEVCMTAIQLLYCQDWAVQLYATDIHIRVHL